MEILGGGLKYYWIVAQFNKQNRNSIIYSRRVMAMWKPILIYSNPPTKQPPKPFCDLISGKRQKDYHLWQQSIHEALHLLSRFAQPWDLVVDPFAGSGTILLASKLLGLSSIGYEIDRDTYVSAIRRMEQEPLDLISFSDHTTCDVKQEVADDG